MKKAFFIITAILSVFILFNIAYAQKKEKFINIVFPKNGQSFPHIKNSMIYGKILKKGSLFINGKKIKTFENGAFLAYVPVKSGNFYFNIQLKTENKVYEKKLLIKISKKLEPIPQNKFFISGALMLPKHNITAPPGEKIHFRCFATPNATVYAKFENSKKKYKLIENKKNNLKGIYELECILKKNFSKKKQIVFELFKNGKKVFERKSKIYIFIDQSVKNKIYEINKNYVKGRTAPDSGYRLLLFKGCRLISTGIFGKYIRLKFNENENIFVDKKDCFLVKNQSFLPKNTLGNILITNKNKTITISSPIKRNVPYEVSIKNKILEIKLYDTINAIDKIIYPKKNNMLLKFFQNKNYLSLNVELPFKPIWGWKASFENSTFKFAINKPLVVDKKNPLKGLKICIDAGHNPGSGAIGPAGTQEKYINWVIADYLSKKIKKYGALPILTRKNVESKASLYERVAIAEKNNSNLFISIHHNSVPNGKNPFKALGTETYFYTSFSKPLADEIHKKIIKAIKLKDNGVRFGNFAVLRNYSMPCILIEPTYIIIPEQEIYINTPEYKEDLTNAIIEGLKNFLLKYGKVI